MNLVPIDASKGCGNWNYMSLSHISVYVKPIPTKPTTTTNVVNYYQGQVAMPLSASTTDSTASLVWYGTNATGGVGSSVAPKPTTDQVGPVTYYVSQKVGSCEGERTAITVLTNPLLGIEDPTLAEAVETFPNPTVSSLTVRIRGVSGNQPAELALLDANGQSVWRQETRHETSVVSVATYPTGNYMLQIKVGDRKTSRRIVKL